MSDQMLQRSQWETFCNRLADQLEGARAEIEVAALGFGDQIQAEWAPLLGVTYDRKDDIFEVAVEGLDHIIHDPETVAVRQDGAQVESLAITTRSGERHLVRFRQPVSLPGPGID